MKKLIRGYEAASQVTGIKIKTLKNLVARRLIRVIKPLHNQIYFDPEQFQEDILAMTSWKIE